MLGDTERSIVLRRIVDKSNRATPGTSARFAGFTDALGSALREIEAGMLEPSDLPRELGALTLAYRAELERLGAWDQGMMRRRAVERLTSELGSWGGAPVFAYGFEDLTGAEWRLLEALAARSEVHVSLPYEPGRAVFESLSRTATDLAALARGDLVELPARSGAYLPAALARVERNVFEDRPAEGDLDGSIRFLEGAGRRATLELVAESVLDLVRGGTAPEEIAIVCPTLERTRASLETAFGSLGIPVAVESRQRLGGTAFGQALLSLLRFSWAAGTRRELFSFLRTPYSGLAADRRGLPRRAPTGPRRPSRRAHGRGDDEAPHRSAAPAARGPHRPRGRRSRPRGSWFRRCSATRTASALRPCQRSRDAICGLPMPPVA